MRLEIKAILNKVDDVVDKADLKYQYILLEKPMFDNFSGEKIRTDYYPATIFNEKIGQINAQDFVGKKVTCVCYLNTQQSESDGKTYHNIRLKIHSMQIIEDKVEA